MLDFIGTRHIFTYLSSELKHPKTGIQAEYTPLEILFIVPTTTSRRRSCPCRNRPHHRLPRSRAAMVACLQATAEAPHATAASGVGHLL
jgi:hypothetical protein